MKNSEPFEDNWHDVVSKAMRGLRLDISLLAERTQIDKALIFSLLKKNILNEKILSAIAPSLNLDPEALLIIARKPYAKSIPKVPKNFQRFTTLYHGMEVHSYLLWSNENQKAIAFDTGADLTPLLTTVSQHQLNLCAIFLTHGHGDHVGQLKELIRLTKVDAWMGKQDLIAPAGTYPFGFQCNLDYVINLEARSTPGHSPGGTTYVIHGTSPSIAVVGDAIFARSVGGIPSSSYQGALEAIEKNILSLSKNTIIAPGHGPLTTVRDEKAYNPFFA